jgi:hypothetical protein
MTKQTDTELKQQQANQQLQNVYINTYIQKLRDRLDNSITENVDLSVKFELQNLQIKQLEEEVQKLNKNTVSFETAETTPALKKAAKKS